MNTLTGFNWRVSCSGQTVGRRDKSLTLSPLHRQPSDHAPFTGWISRSHKAKLPRKDLLLGLIQIACWYNHSASSSGWSARVSSDYWTWWSTEGEKTQFSWKKKRFWHHPSLLPLLQNQVNNKASLFRAPCVCFDAACLSSPTCSLCPQPPVDGVL